MGSKVIHEGGGEAFPVFGRRADRERFRNLMSDFTLTAFQCVSHDPDIAVNVLHLGTESCPTNLPHILNVAQLANGSAFTVAKPTPFDWRDADVLFVGTDEGSLEKAGRIVESVEDVVGLVCGWDVLMYGVDSTVTTAAKPPARPACAGPNFVQDGLCLLHAHVRRRDDTYAWQGLFTYMAIELETYLDKALGGWSGRSLASKIRALREKIRGGGRVGPDAELFLAAAEVVRTSRNAVAHSQRNVPDERRRASAEKADVVFWTFHVLCSRHGRTDLFGGQNWDLHRTWKYLYKVAVWARLWIYEYAEAANSRP